MKNSLDAVISINNLLVLTDINNCMWDFYDLTSELSLDDIKVIKRLSENEEINNVFWLKKKTYSLKYLIDHINEYSDLVSFFSEMYLENKDNNKNVYNKNVLFFIKYLASNKNNLNVIKSLLLELKENNELFISLSMLDNLLINKKENGKKLIIKQVPSYY